MIESRSCLCRSFWECYGAYLLLLPKFQVGIIPYLTLKSRVSQCWQYWRHSFPPKSPRSPEQQSCSAGKSILFICIQPVLLKFPRLGYMSGPPLAALLFIAGGFKLPFFTAGGLSLLLTILCGVFFPGDDEMHEQSNVNLSKSLIDAPPLAQTRIIVISFPFISF